MYQVPASGGSQCGMTPPGRSFDHGEFEIGVEAVPGRVPERILVNG
jgi:hypothetical protein